VYNELIAHQMYLQRYARGVVLDINPLIYKMVKEIKQKAKSENLEDVISQYRFIIDVLSISNEYKEIIKDKLANELLDLFEIESKYSNTLLKREGIDDDVIVAWLALDLLSHRVMFGNNSKTIGEMIDDLFASITITASTAIQTGLVMEVDDLNNFVADSSERSNSFMEALVITLVNSVGSVARSKTWQSAKGFVLEEEYVAVLDSRTTILCASLDGKIFKVGEGQQTPAHYRCRSIRVPRFKGTTPNRDNYEEFLNKQSDDFVDDFLGKERATLWRDGKLNLEQFVDYSGKTITLKELKALYNL